LPIGKGYGYAFFVRPNLETFFEELKLSPIEYVLLALLLASVALNAVLVSHRKLKQKSELTQDAAMVLNDLTRSGQTLVRISRIDPDDMFLRSPRDLA